MFHLCVDVVSDFSDIVRCVSIDIHRATLYALLTGLKVGAAYQNSVKIFTNFLGVGNPLEIAPLNKMEQLYNLNANNETSKVRLLINVGSSQILVLNNLFG